MCGRFTLQAQPQDLIELFELDELPEELRLRFNTRSASRSTVSSAKNWRSRPATVGSTARNRTLKATRRPRARPRVLRRIAGDARRRAAQGRRYCSRLPREGGHGAVVRGRPGSTSSTSNPRSLGRRFPRPLTTAHSSLHRSSRSPGRGTPGSGRCHRTAGRPRPTCRAAASTCPRSTARPSGR